MSIDGEIIKVTPYLIPTSESSARKEEKGSHLFAQRQIGVTPFASEANRCDPFCSP
jgi:hypothetical protein